MKQPVEFRNYKPVSKVSIVILNFNGKDLLSMPLDSIEKLNYPKELLEVIIVDNGSTDGSIEFLKIKNVRVVALKDNKGYSSMNAGIAKATGEFLFLLNNDLALEKNCITELVRTYTTNPGIGILSPLILDTKYRVMATRYISRSYYCGGTHIPYKKSKLLPVQDAAFVGLIFFHKSLIKKLGGQVWDPDYFLYAEDLDISLRTHMLGLNIKQVNTAIVSHVWDGTISKYFSSPTRAYLSERNLLVTFLKDADMRSIVLYSPLVILARTASIIRQLIVMDFPVVRAKLRAYTYAFVHIRQILKKRRAVQSRRVVADSKFFPKLCNEKAFIKNILGIN